MPGSLYGYSPWGGDTAEAMASGTVKSLGGDVGNSDVSYNGRIYGWDQGTHGWVDKGPLQTPETPPGPSGPGLDFSAIGKTLVPEPLGFRNAFEPLQGLQRAAGGGATPIAHQVQPERLRGGLGNRAPASLQALMSGKVF